MEGQILELLLGGGSSFAVGALLFWLYTKERARSEAVTDRYIAHLELEAAEDDSEDEKVTRPLPSRERIARISAVKS